MVGGQVLGAVAFGFGAVALVEPLLASNLLFALPLTALYHHRRMRVSDFLGALTLVVGLAVFVVASRPDGGSPRAPGVLAWSVTFAALVAVVLVLVLAQRRLGAVARAGVLAVGAGLIFGTQDTVTQAADALIGRGLVPLLASWVPYAVLVLAVSGLLLAQSAFGTAPLSASLPPITMAEPLMGIVLGIVLYGEQVRTSPLALVGAALGLAAVVGGIVVLGRSPLVTGELHRIENSGCGECPCGRCAGAAGWGGSALHNIGRGEGCSVLDVLRTIAEVTGLDVRPEVVARRRGDPARVVAAVDRIRAGLGVTSASGLPAIVESAWLRWQYRHTRSHRLDSPSG